MHTKYSDASFMEKSASEDRLVTSRDEMQGCCKTAAADTSKEGNFRCPCCGNDLYVGDSE